MTPNPKTAEHPRPKSHRMTSVIGMVLRDRANSPITKVDVMGGYLRIYDDQGVEYSVTVEIVGKE